MVKRSCPTCGEEMEVHPLLKVVTCFLHPSPEENEWRRKQAQFKNSLDQYELLMAAQMVLRDQGVKDHEMEVTREGNIRVRGAYTVKVQK